MLTEEDDVEIHALAKRGWSIGPSPATPAVTERPFAPIYVMTVAAWALAQTTERPDIREKLAGRYEAGEGRHLRADLFSRPCIGPRQALSTRKGSRRFSLLSSGSRSTVQVWSGHSRSSGRWPPSRTAVIVALRSTS